MQFLFRNCIRGKKDKQRFGGIESGRVLKISRAKIDDRTWPPLAINYCVELAVNMMHLASEGKNFEMQG